MSQQNNTTNWVFHDQNGQAQVIKLVQTPGNKSISGLVTSPIGSQPMKAVFKSPSTGQDSAQSVINSGSQFVRTIGVPNKIGSRVMVPVSQLKGSEGQYIQKTLRLSSPMRNIKLVNAINPQKVQQINTSTPNVQSSKSFISPILDHSGSRKRQEIDADFTPEYKRRKTEKVGKGLRHFSMKVCEKVRKKGTTSYNEVADELVGEFTNPTFNSSLSDQYDQKNIRRRVYDALNVLMAMNIISKEKKEIRWLGLPTNSLQECIQLEKEKQKNIQRIRDKNKQLHELILRQISFKNLVERNKNTQQMHGPPPSNSTIQLPFIVLNTNKKTVIECSISNNKMDYIFDFNDKFEINDDMDVLKRLGLLMGLDKGEVSPENLEKFKSFVPKSLEEYVIQLANGETDPIKQILDSAGPGPSSMSLNAEDLVETTLGENTSHQSSISDPLSPHIQDFTDEDAESEDMSSDVDIN